MGFLPFVSVAWMEKCIEISDQTTLNLKDIGICAAIVRLIKPFLNTGPIIFYISSNGKRHLIEPLQHFTN